MEKTDHLLIILSEECSEIIKEVSKALRFGLDDKEPHQALTNREKIVNEFNDLFAVMNMLKDHGTFKESELISLESIDRKTKKVEKYMKYAESKGKLIIE